MTDNSYASPWQPIEMNGQDPHVRPNYYAFAAMAQILGSGNGTTQVAPLNVSGISTSYTPYVRAYAIYTKGNLSGVAIINGMTTNATDTDQQSLTVQISLPDFKGKTLFISALTADGADSTDGTTWNGISYGTSNGKSSGSSSFAVVPVDSDGSASISVRDSQAVVANIDYALGTRAVVMPSSGTQTSAKKSAALSTYGGAQTALFAGGLTTLLAFATSVVLGWFI
jgi:hypothetical protein